MALLLSTSPATAFLKYREIIEKLYSSISAYLWPSKAMQSLFAEHFSTNKIISDD